MNTINSLFFKTIPYCALILLIACQSNTDQLQTDLKESYQELSNRVSKIYDESEQKLTEMTDAEIQKLSNIEYKVAEFTTDSSSSDIEKSLAQLGKDRWSCFASNQTADKLQVFCKRQPISYLRAVMRAPRLVP